MQLFAFALLAFATVTAHDRVCEPGSRTTTACRDCICSRDGTSQACTLNLCPEEGLSNVRSRRETAENNDKSGDSNVEKPKICEPNTKSKVECNDCTCSADGTFQTCTLMLCPPESLTKDIKIEEKISTVDQSDVTKPKICEPYTKSKVDCNDCTCSADGTFQTCTLMLCSPESLTKDTKIEENMSTVDQSDVTKPKICEPNTKSKVECNDCTCSADGTFQACTLMLCSPESLTKDTKIEEKMSTVDQSDVKKPKICEPGTSSKMDCNTCICSADGTFHACTLMMCLPESLSKVTNPEETITTVGESDETTPKAVYNDDGSLNVVGLVASSPMVRRKRQISDDRPCEPKSEFKIDCNDCKCGSDGFSVACTKMKCLEGHYNEDGSLRRQA